MKLKLLNTPLGLKPCYEDDYDEKKKLKIGEVYEADIKLVRNIRFHRLFSLLSTSAMPTFQKRLKRAYSARWRASGNP